MSDLHRVLFYKLTPEREQLLAWLKAEWAYADAKFGDQRPGHDGHMWEDGVGEGGWWFAQVFQYVRRAEVLGLDSLQGRQAIAKCWAAMGGMVESVIRTHGDLPPGGRTSGVIR